MKRNKTFITALVASTLFSTAGATDHRIWREQVPLQTGPAIELESVPADPAKKRAIDSLPWREQVKTTAEPRVYIAEPALGRHGDSESHLIWSEQIGKIDSDAELAVASER